jgi:tryptophanyl-tRNA synthetase
MRERYAELRSKPEQLDAVLEDGATRARQVARATITRVRNAIGIN